MSRRVSRPSVFVFGILFLSLAFIPSRSPCAEILGGMGVTPDKDGDSAHTLIITYLRHGLDLEGGYVNKRIIDRNRFNLGPTGRSVPGYAYLAVRYRWQWTWGRFQPFFSTGGMYVSKTSTLTSTHFQFSHGAGTRVGRFEVSWRHFSNADLGDQNEGDDMLLVQYRF